MNVTDINAALSTFDFQQLNEVQSHIDSIRKKALVNETFNFVEGTKVQYPINRGKDWADGIVSKRNLASVQVRSEEDGETYKFTVDKLRMAGSAD